MKKKRVKVVFKKRETNTVQKSVRIPRTILKYIETKTAGTGLTVPKAVVQVLQNWFENDGFLTSAGGKQ